MRTINVATENTIADDTGTDTETNIPTTPSSSNHTIPSPRISVSPTIPGDQQTQHVSLGQQQQNVMDLIRNSEHQSIIDATTYLRNLPSTLEFTGLRITSAERRMIISMETSEEQTNNQTVSLLPSDSTELLLKLVNIKVTEGSQSVVSHTLDDARSEFNQGSALESTYESTPRSTTASGQESSSPWEPVESAESSQHRVERGLPPRNNDFDVRSVSTSTSGWISHLSGNRLSTSDIDAIEELCLNPDIAGDGLRHTLHYTYNLEQEVVEIIVRLSRGAM